MNEIYPPCGVPVENNGMNGIPQEVAELVRAPKRSREGPILEFKKKRDSTREIYTSLAGTEFFLAKL